MGYTFISKQITFRSITNETVPIFRTSQESKLLTFSTTLCVHVSLHSKHAETYTLSVGACLCYTRHISGLQCWAQCLQPFKTYGGLSQPHCPIIKHVWKCSLTTHQFVPTFNTLDRCSSLTGDKTKDRKTCKQLHKLQ